jgi:hypothetical protein
MPYSKSRARKDFEMESIKLLKLAKKVSFDTGRGGSPGNKGGASSDSGKKQMKTRCPEWQVTKKGNTFEHEG